MTVADIQGWMTSIGVLATGTVAFCAFVQSVLNGRTLARVANESKVRADALAEHVVRVETATNGMKKELEEKAFLAGARSTDGTVTATELVTRATETAAIAAKVVAEAAKTAADLVATTEAARGGQRSK